MCASWCGFCGGVGVELLANSQQPFGALVSDGSGRGVKARGVVPSYAGPWIATWTTRSGSRYLQHHHLRLVAGSLRERRGLPPACRACASREPAGGGMARRQTKQGGKGLAPLRRLLGESNGQAIADAK